MANTIAFLRESHNIGSLKRHPTDTPGATSYAHDYGSNGVIHEIHTFSPTAVLDGFFGRNLGDADTGNNPLGVGSGLASQLVSLGASVNFLATFQGVSGTLCSRYGYFATSADRGKARRIPEYADDWTFGGSFTKIIGRHTLKMGANFATNNTMLADLQHVGFVQYRANPKSEQPSGTGDSFASFLLGLPDSAGRRNVLETEHGGWVNGGYFQDEFKVNAKLTMNLGLRYDVTLWPIYGQATRA